MTTSGSKASWLPWAESTSINLTHIDFTSKVEWEHRCSRICSPLARRKGYAKSAGAAQCSLESRSSTFKSMSICRWKQAEVFIVRDFAMY